MKQIQASGIFALLFIGAFTGTSNCSAMARYGADDSKPNIIFIMADDMGYGDPQCYNPDSKIPTPNMNRLAREGMLFRDAHAASSVCTPSRYSFITGKYAWRSRLKSEVLWSTYDEPLIPANEYTIADALRSAGYATAVIGKWHLGINFQKNLGIDFVRPKDWHENGRKGVRDVSFIKPNYGGPNDLGFNYFFGLGAGHNIEPHVFIENRYTAGLPTEWRKEKQSSRPGISASEVHEGWMLPGWDDTQIGPTLTARALSFIESSASKKEPFFLFLPMQSPHRPSTPPDFVKGISQAGERGDMVAEFDWTVGQVMAKLDSLGISKNTIVIVSSDNGATKTSDNGKDYDHKSCGLLNGYKASLTEGGHRVPFIVKWPKVVKPGSNCDGLVSIMDLFATFSQILRLPAPQGDGISFLNLLKNPDAQPDRKGMVHHTYSGAYALRSDYWKFIPVRSPTDGSWSYLLYDLRLDPYERNNLSHLHPDLVERFNNMLNELINM